MKKTLFLFLIAFSANAQVREVAGVSITVADLDREIRFFKDVLAFEAAKGTTSIRSAELHLGAERIELIQPAQPGRPIPLDSRSFDLWFQHIAIVVSDMDKAYAQLRRHNVKQVSTGPQTLPDWNKDAGGIKAFYFRDPEDHVLEIIWFPPGKGDPKWQQPTGRLFLGIDHTAIVVSDTERSLTFYRDMLGMKVAGGAENYGTEQEHLNQVFGARLRITALRAERGPGIEFLEYITPPGGRALPGDAKANDLIFWQTWLNVDDLNLLERRLHSSGARFVSRGKDTAQLIVRDPNGHAL